jgi:uncharacterized membrane protein YukC
MPENVEQAQKIKPPTINLKPEKDQKQESMKPLAVDSLCIMKPLIEELLIIGQLIEAEEQQTPPTEGEAAHTSALELLKSIDSGIKTLNTGLQALAAETKPKEAAEEVEAEDEVNAAEDEAKAGEAEAQATDMADLEQELQKLGVPQQ